MTTQLDKARQFQALHERAGAFVIPNPWDAGSARLLAGLGFEALATTSSGFANAHGRVDGEMTLEEKIAHCRILCSATALPVSADLENCFADDPQTAAKTIARVAQTGVVGGSIEDYTGDASKPIYDFTLAVERVQAAAETAKSLDFPFTLTARAENLLRGWKDLDETIRRLQAFEAAGADVLYAPALKSLDEVRAVTGALSKPVNVLAPMLRTFSVPELADAGAKRISIGGALSRALNATLLRAAKEMRDEGTFGWCEDLASGGEITALLGVARS